MNALLELRQGAGPGWLAATLVVVRWLLVAFFGFVAYRNLAGDAQMTADFARWGYPDWFRVLTAVLQIGGAVLLISPRSTFAGAALLACILVGAMGTHALHDPPMTVAVPAAFLLIVVPLLIAYPASR